MTSENPPILDAELPAAGRELRVGTVLRGGEARKAEFKRRFGQLFR